MREPRKPRIWLRAPLRERDRIFEGAGFTLGKAIRRMRGALGWLSRQRIPLASPALNAGIAASVVLIAISAFVARDFSQRYPVSRTLDSPVDRQLVLLTRDGAPFARRGGCIGGPVRLDEVPRHLLNAVLAVEDRRFYNHIGIDPVGLVRAFLANREAGRIVQGGSTITQQLAKISYLSPKKTYERKFEEALVALWLELNLTKQQILERYLNRVYFGKGCFGVRAAARHYFNTPIEALTLPQSIYLISLLRSPSTLSDDRAASREREKLVLNAMVQDGHLESAAAASLPSAQPRLDRGRDFGGYYADWIARNVELPDDGSMTPLPVRTSFDPGLQRLAEKTVQAVIKKQGARHKAGQAALVAMRPDGRVLAMVGGSHYTDSQFNRATQAKRQPGSSFKTFVYLAALRAGADADMMVSDEPVSIDGWEPKNYNHRYRGPVSIRRAFASSINSVAVRVSEAVGREHVITAARHLGITTPLPSVPSIALGVTEVTLLEQTAAYAAIAAGAYPVKPWGVEAIGDGRAETARPPARSGEWRLDRQAQLKGLLSSVVNHGTGRRARLPVQAYGKTGTSQEYRDAWFIGFAGNLVVGVWVGNDDNSPMRRVTGGSLPAQIWHDFMNAALKTDKEFTPRPRQIAAFAAKPHNREIINVRLDMLETPEPSGYSGAWFGGPIPSFFAPNSDWTAQPQPNHRYRRGRPSHSTGIGSTMDGG